MIDIQQRLKFLLNQSLELYTPIVDDIIQNKLKDEKYIERTLDSLLDICFNDRGLLLYKMLCRYYFNINPQATIDYINYYRNMYEKEGLDRFKSNHGSTAFPVQLYEQH